MFLDWLSGSGFELAGAFIGLVYLYFSIRQSIWLWPLGILASGLSVYVFSVSKFYADMGLNVYYVLISIYGWIHWVRGGSSQSGEVLPVSRLKWLQALILFLVFVVLFFLLAYILLRFTDSPVPWWDAFTTAGSILATWMLARKIIEHWLLWIVVDAVSAGLYIYRDLYAYFILFLVYTTMAFIGFIQWKKDLKTS